MWKLKICPSISKTVLRTEKGAKERYVQENREDG
jgi:hypothetical protein